MDSVFRVVTFVCIIFCVVAHFKGIVIDWWLLPLWMAIELMKDR